MKKIAVIAGTRPEIIKLFPLYLELKKYFNCQFIHTGQHSSLAEDQLSFLKLKPFLNLGIMTVSQKQSDIFSTISKKLGNYFSIEKPDLVITQGDTATAFSASLLAYSCNIPVAHIEAGLRTNDLSSPFPEEGYRQMISRIASLNFCPTLTSSNNLNMENIKKNKIFVVGNTVVDSLKWLKSKKIPLSKNIATLLSESGKQKLVLVTLHRRENFGAGHLRILHTIRTLAKKYKSEVIFIFPVHPNPKIKNLVSNKLTDLDNVLLIDPLSYFDFINIMKKCQLIISDSGGVQEEAPSFKVKVLVTRDHTERPEGVHSGTSVLVGANSKKLMIEFEKNISRVKSKTFTKNPFGDGKSSRRIRKVIFNFLNGKQ